ncbi:MAG TPA: PKD domain-containing protein [Ohtaekwangia sp.]|nr:PKD domain-containing protein [Ohtaekwangia sp.]
MSVRSLNLVFLLCFIFGPFMSRAQTLEGHNWYFGSSTDHSIRFSRSDHTATIITNKASLGTGGSAVVSNPVNGDLLFYTDGNTVYDITHTAMPNGGGLIGNPAGNQPVVAGKVPGEPNKYYVITNDANFTTPGNIRYTMVDMALPGNPSPLPLGNVDETIIAKNTPVPGLSNRSEAMITIPHANGTDFWLITHASIGFPEYTATLFTATGPTTTVTAPNLGVILRAGNFAYNPTTQQVAVSPQETSRNVEIFDFDNATGQFTLATTVLNSSVSAMTTNAVYDVEWSNNGRYLYVSKAGENGSQPDLIQYDLTSSAETPISPVSILPQPNTITRSFGLQMAADSAIYHLYESGGQILLGKILDADTVATELTYEPIAFAGDFQGQQLSSFAPATDIDLTVDFTFSGLCQNAPTSFYPTVSPQADSLVWDFGDGATSSEWSPVHTYEEGETFPVTVTAYLNGVPTPSPTHNVIIQPFDVQITLVSDTTACSCELPFPKKPAPPCQAFTLTAQTQGSASVQYQWYGPAGVIGSPASSPPALMPDSAGYYYLVASEPPPGVCSTYAGVNIKEYTVQDPRSNMWYFGNGAGLDFNSLYWTPPTPGPTPISNGGAMNAPEGTSTMSDRNGQVIFYTDGDKVWNRQNVEVASGIGGDKESTQSAIIIPVPGDETLFYIFTTQEVHGAGTYELRYVLFDLKLNNGTGGIGSPSSVLFTRSTERITASANWLIAHEYGNNSFRAYEITAEGIGSPVISGVGSDHAVTNANQGQGYMILGPQNQIAVALDNTVELFDFVDSSGVVTNFRSVDLQQPGQAYGIGFSPGGQRLYATILGENFIYELAYDSTLSTYTTRPELPPMPTTAQPGAIQRGPDGQIYVALQGSTTLGAITPSEVNTPVPLPSQFNENAVQLLAGTSSTLGLPNFIQSLGDPIQGPGVTANGFCLGAPTEFTASGKDSSIDKFFWTFGDGTAEVEGSAEMSYTYAVEGTYPVQVRIWNKCEEITLDIQVTINPSPDPDESLFASNDPGGNVVPCNGPVTLLGSNPPVAPGDPPTTWLWSTGETTETIAVLTPGTYTVTVTNQFGCTATKSAELFPSFANLDLGPDVNVCQDTEQEVTLTIQGGITFTWFENGVPTGNTAYTQPVNTSTPGDITYSVEIDDGNCTATDEVTFTINPTPVFTAVGVDATCSQPDGSINLDVTTPVGTPLVYSVTGPSTVPDGTDRIAAFSESIPNLSAGAYTVRVADQLTGCAATEVVPINNPGVSVTLTQQGTCDPDLFFEVNPGGAGEYEYVVLNSAGVQVDFGSTSPNVVTTFNTNALPSGDTYTVQVTNVITGCLASGSADLLQTLPAHTPVISPIDCATNQLTAIAAGATDFTWTSTPANGIVAPGTGPTVTLNPGTFVVEVTASGAGACPGTTTETRTASPPIDAEITPSTPCANTVTVTVDPRGNNYRYMWSINNGAFGPWGPERTFRIADHNSSVIVQVINNLNGCQDNSQERLIPVVGTVTVALNPPTLACEGSDFDLTASSRPDATFEWSFDQSPLNAGTGATITTPVREGVYSVVAIVSTCRSLPAEINIAPLLPTPIDLGVLKRICPFPQAPAERQQVMLNAKPADLTSYSWLPPDGIPVPGNAEFIATMAGVYNVTAVNPEGCESTASVEVIEDCDPIITGPNAFRPSSKLEPNTAFRLFTFFIDPNNFEIIIFNRWGEMVYESDDINFAWNGGYKNNVNQILPGGTYSYVVRYKIEDQPEKGVQEKRGGVVLLR